MIGMVQMATGARKYVDCRRASDIFGRMREGSPSNLAAENR